MEQAQEFVEKARAWSGPNTFRLLRYLASRPDAPRRAGLPALRGTADRPADRRRPRRERGSGALRRLRTDEPVANIRRTRRTAVPRLLLSAPGGPVCAVRQAREGSGTTSGRTDLPSVQGEGAGLAQGVRQLPPDDDSHPAPCPTAPTCARPAPPRSSRRAAAVAVGGGRTR